MNKFFTLIFTFFAIASFAQTTADFENYQIDVDSFLNGSDGNNLFSSGNISLDNDYNSMWNSWNGWAISHGTDVSTVDFNNLSTINGMGYDGSNNYAVSFSSDQNIMHLDGAAAGEVVAGMYVNNLTVAYNIIKDGNQFSKKFGGLTGDDPDFFLLTIKKYLGGTLSSEVVEFYLADYQFTDNAQDYIIDDWAWVDLTSLGQADSLAFSLTSTDNGNYGMNTPAYFAVDNVETSDGIVAVDNVEAESLFTIYPNPASEFFVLKNLENENALVSIFDMTGRLVYNNTLTGNQNEVNIQNLANGTYMVKVLSNEKVASQLLIKQ
jgi:hypothetical protein